jgi:hypothetical protein
LLLAAGQLLRQMMGSIRQADQVQSGSHHFTATGSGQSRQQERKFYVLRRRQD